MQRIRIRNPERLCLDGSVGVRLAIKSNWLRRVVLIFMPRIPLRRRLLELL